MSDLAKVNPVDIGCFGFSVSFVLEENMFYSVVEIGLGLRKGFDDATEPVKKGFSAAVLETGGWLSMAVFSASLGWNLSDS